MVLVNAAAGRRWSARARPRCPEALAVGLHPARGVGRGRNPAERSIKEAAERARERGRRGRDRRCRGGGGDGTISTVASVLAGTGIPLGVLPLGTLNHFAKDLGIPLDLEGAVQVICAANTRAVDVAEVNGQVFVNNSSIGLYPYMVLDRERRRNEHGQAKWVATCWAVLRTLRYLPRRRLSIRAEGWSEPCRTPCLFVGNNEYGLAASTLGKARAAGSGRVVLLRGPARKPDVVGVVGGEVGHRADRQAARSAHRQGEPPPRSAPGQVACLWPWTAKSRSSGPRCATAPAEALCGSLSRISDPSGPASPRRFTRGRAAWQRSPPYWQQRSP